MEFSFKSILERYFASKKKDIEYNIYLHKLRDPGVYKNAADFLRSFQKEYRYALVSFDKEGCGKEEKSTEEISYIIKENLKINGWKERAEVIVIEPELEIWAWTDSIHMAKAVGWPDYSQLKNFITEKKLWSDNMPKPLRPKEAFELALKEKKIPRSSSIYKKIADKVSLTRCEDKSFKKLLTILEKWF